MVKDDINSLERKAYETYKPRVSGALGETINLMLELNDGMIDSETIDITDQIFCFSTIPVRETLFARIAKEKEDFDNINPNIDDLTKFKSYIELKMPAKSFEENDNLSALYDIYKNIKNISSRLKVIKTIEEVCEDKAIINYDNPDPEMKKRIENIVQGDPAKLLQDKKVLEKEIKQLEKKFAIEKTEEQGKIDILRKEIETYIKEVGNAYRIEADFIEQPEQIQMVIDAYTEHMENITGAKKEAVATHEFVETRLAKFFPYFTRAMTDKDTRELFNKNKISAGTAITKWGGIFGYSLTNANKIETGKNAPKKKTVLTNLNKIFTSKGGKKKITKKKKKITKKKEEKKVIKKEPKEKPKKEIKIEDMPKGIANWPEFVKKIGAGTGLSAKEKGVLWHKYSEIEGMEEYVTKAIEEVKKEEEKEKIVTKPTKAKKKPYQVQIKPKGGDKWKDMAKFDSEQEANKHATHLKRGAIGLQTQVIKV